MSKPARPLLKFNSLDDLVADVDQLRAKPYDKAGQWDLPMILDHLAKIMRGPFTPVITRNIPWPLSPIVRFIFRRFAQREFYPNIQFPAPSKLKPTTGLSVDAAYAELLQAVRQVQAAGGETVQCPPFGELPLEDFRKMQLLHGAHHLSFLKLKST